MTWETEATGRTVVTIKVAADRAKTWEQWFLLTSDVHFDNPMCQRQMYKRHLDQALERNAANLDFGDFQCAMQGKNDPRHEKGHIMAEDNVPDYFGAITRNSFAFLKPYVSTQAVRGRGNHEAVILKKNEIDLTRALVERINAGGGHAVAAGYRGWVRIMLQAGTMRQTFRLYYTHGSGGSAPVTKGVIKTNRRASYIDADIIVGGHIHEAWSLDLRRACLTEKGREATTDQVHLCIPTYKDEYVDQPDGFHNHNESPPKPLGAWWLRFFWNTHTERFCFDYSRAK